ncbi:MAG: cytochrome P450 [Lautropia sp.]
MTLDGVGATGARLRRIADLPGPAGLPLLGNLLQLRGPQAHLRLEAWHARYGDFYRFSLGSREFLAVADAQVIGAILRDRPDGFQRTARGVAIGAELGLDGLFLANGDRWRRQRPMVMAAFSPTLVRRYFDDLVRVAERLRGRWVAAAACGEPIDLLADLMRFTVDVTAGLAFGADVDSMTSGDDEIRQHLDQVFPALYRRLRAPLPYWRHVRLPRDRALQHHLRALDRAVARFIADARARLASDPARAASPPNLIEAMLVARDQPGSGVDDRDVAANVLTMLLAGEDTTANTIAWTVVLLHRHPSILATVRNEVRAVLRDETLARTPEQLDRLDVLEACAREAMRLKPVAPTIALQAAEDRVVGDVRVPAGAHVMCLLRPPATDPRRMTRASAFDPTRWAGVADAQALPGKQSVMSFGAGPRICPGRYLALHEIRMALGMLLAGFDIVDVQGPDGAEPAERLAFVMGPEPVTMRIALRAPGARRPAATLATGAASG